jgi:hypothetical protein
MAVKLKIEKRGMINLLNLLLSQFQPNFAEMIIGWSPSNIVSGISDFQPRWLPLPNLI